MQSVIEGVDYDSVARTVLKEGLKRSGGRVCMDSMRTVYRRLDAKKGSWFLVIFKVSDLIQKEGLDKFVQQ